VSYLFALVAETKLVSASDLRRLAVALEAHGRDVARAFGFTAATCEVADDRDKLPPWAHPIVFVDDEQDPGALAVHYWDPVRSGPAARVYVGRGSGMAAGSQSIVESASHESGEARANARTNLWAPHPDPFRRAEGVELAFENCDPCQDTYAITIGGTVWNVANFVYPQWFDGRFNDDAVRQRYLAAGGRFDHAGRLTRPGQIAPTGYVICRAYRNGRIEHWYEDAAGGRFGSAPVRNPRDRAAKEHAMSRGVVITGGEP
jgi:hypothetical protein